MMRNMADESPAASLVPIEYVPIARGAILMLLLLAAPAAIAAACEQFESQLKRTYGFRPTQLDEKRLERKSEEMDAVWDAVHQDPQTLVPCLKKALARPTDDTWFLFDGSQLLVAVDPSKEAKTFLLEGLSRVSLDDVDLRSWVAAASALGFEGFNTAALGKRWLSYPHAEYFLPEHGSYQVDRGNGAMFVFGAMDERYATPALIEIARGQQGQAREIAVWLLMSQATPEALRALQTLETGGLSARTISSLEALRRQPRLIVPRETPKTSREEFLAAFKTLLAGDESAFDGLVESVPDGERDLVAVATGKDLDLLRKVRRYYIAKNNQHAIEYYNQFTQILMTLVWKPERERR
jgi:hypothetical protein